MSNSYNKYVYGLFNLIRRARDCVDGLYLYVANSNHLDGMQMRQQHKITQHTTNKMYVALNELEYIVRLKM